MTSKNADLVNEGRDAKQKMQEEDKTHQELKVELQNIKEKLKRYE